MSVVAAHPGPAIWGAIVILVSLTAYGILRLTGEEGTHHKPRAWRRALVAVRHQARTTGLVPGAGFPKPSPVTTATCPSAIATPKVDSPAPENVPGLVVPADRHGSRGDRSAGPGTTIATQRDPALYGAALPELPPDSLDASCTYTEQRPLTDWLRDSVVMPAIRGL